jgi:hypothetical protein
MSHLGSATTFEVPACCSGQQSMQPVGEAIWYAPAPVYMEQQPSQGHPFPWDAGEEPSVDDLCGIGKDRLFAPPSDDVQPDH